MGSLHKGYKKLLRTDKGEGGREREKDSGQRGSISMMTMMFVHI